MENRVLFSNILKKIIKEEVDNRVEKCKIELEERLAVFQSELEKIAVIEGSLKGLKDEVKELTSAVTTDIETLTRTVKRTTDLAETANMTLSRVEGTQKLYRDCIEKLRVELEK